MPTLTPRRRLIRDAIIYTPPFTFLLVVIALMLVGVIGFTIFGLIVLVGLAFLFGYQSIQSLRDLLDQPRDIVGPIRRRWTKRDGFVVKNYYISVEKGIFHIPVDDYMSLKLGDTVRVHAFPHTGTIVSVTKEGESAPRPETRPAPSQPKGRARTLRTARVTPRERREPPPDEADD